MKLVHKLEKDRKKTGNEIERMNIRIEKMKKKENRIYRDIDIKKL